MEYNRFGTYMSTCILLGAGASLIFGIPLFNKLAKNFEKEKDHKKYFSRIKEMKKEFNKVGYNIDIENYISYLKAQEDPINTLLRMNPYVSKFVYNSKIYNFGKRVDAKTIRSLLENYVYRNLFIYQLSIKNQIETHYDGFFSHINEKYFGSEDLSDLFLDIFTTNYDNAIEEYAERKEGLSYFDGFEETGDKFAYFRPELYEARIANFNLYKLHGSVRLGVVENRITKERKIIVTKSFIQIGELYRDDWYLVDRVMLLGSNKTLSKDPYFELLKLMKTKLMDSERCIVVGFSFSDEPVRNIFQDVLNYREDDFEIILVSPSSNLIKSRYFNDYNQVTFRCCGFSEYLKI